MSQARQLQGVRLMRPFVCATTLLLCFPAGPFCSAAETSADAVPSSAELTREALEAHRRAARLESGWAEVYDHGVELAERAVALDPRNADAYYALFLNLGSKSERSGIAAQAGKIGKLKALLDKTLELDPRHAHALEAKGEMLMRLPWLFGGSERKGLEALHRAAELAPEWPKPPLRLAEHYWRARDVEKARSYAAEARERAQRSGDSDWLRESQQLLDEISRTGR